MVPHRFSINVFQVCADQLRSEYPRGCTSANGCPPPNSLYKEIYYCQHSSKTLWHLRVTGRNSCTKMIVDSITSKNSARKHVRGGGPSWLPSAAAEQRLCLAPNPRQQHPLHSTSAPTSIPSGNGEGYWAPLLPKNPPQPPRGAATRSET